MPYLGDRYRHGDAAAVGILVANLGTPDAPTAEKLRPYLREFLSDPRVIELPPWKWRPILELFVLTTRPKESAKLYASVWTQEGSPLLVGTRTVAERLEAALRAGTEAPIHAAVGMRYGNPSIASAVDELVRKGCRRILALPLYPQYSATTTASTFDALFPALAAYRWVPELRTIATYHDDPGYVDALAASIREVWARDGEPAKLLFSFHGVPKRYFVAGDPYYCACQKTARLVAERLGIADQEGRWLVCFQSLFGKEEWLQPYTDKTVARLGREGLASLDVICPGFAVDCLETLEEIDGLNRELFEHSGGGRFRYIPCLNDREDHVAALAALARRHLAGWLEPVAAAADPGRREATRERAEAAAAAYPTDIDLPRRPGE